MLPEGLDVIHQPARLALMTLLYQRGDVGAPAARDATGLTAGNLDSHAKRLGEAGFLEGRRSLTKEGFEVRYRLTPAGLQAMSAYLDWLEGFATALKAARKPAAAARAPP